ncbi:hypothetical protein WJX77_010057 [Trebouxia sp. C0004]
MAMDRVLALQARLDAARDKLDAELDKEAPRDIVVVAFQEQVKELVAELKMHIEAAGHQRVAGALSSSDRVRLDGKIAVLKRGDLETGPKTFLNLFKRGDDDLDLQKDGKSAGRLLLTNINKMVAVESAQIEVLGPNGESVESFSPMDDGNGLSEELFVYGTVIRVFPCKGPHAAGGTLELLMNYSVVMQHLRNRIVHGHSD